jgi:response regulator of citrate/malate metabolism
MPFGAKKGEKMKDISDGYLLKPYDTQKLSKGLKEYIENRVAVLRTRKKD